MDAQMNAFEKFFQAGQDAYAEKDWLTANEQLENAYILEQSDQLLLLLVDSLAQSEQFQQAWDLIQNHNQLYQITVDRANLYLKIALANQMYLAAWEFALNSPWTDRLVDQIKLKERQDQVELAQTIKNRGRHFFNLSDVELPEQAQRLQMAEMLPRHYFISGAKTLLVDPFLPAISRATLADRLRRLQVSDEIDFLWIDQKIKKIVPNQLLAIEDSFFWKKIKTVLENGAIHDDPVILEGLEKQLYLEMTVSYPHYPKFNLDANAWIQTELGNVQFDQVRPESDLQARYHQQLLNELMNLM